MFWLGEKVGSDSIIKGTLSPGCGVLVDRRRRQISGERLVRTWGEWIA